MEIDGGRGVKTIGRSLQGRRRNDNRREITKKEEETGVG